METGYFGNLKNMRHVRTVSVSRGIPPWYKGPQFIALAPSYEMLRLPKDEYIIQYKKILSRLDPAEVYEELKDSVIICWEKPGEFCHRRLIAEWIEEKIGVVVPEFGIVRKLIPAAKDTPCKVKVEKKKADEPKNLFGSC